MIYTYDDVIKNNLILEKRKKYTARDLYKIINFGYNSVTALFIIKCSSLYYYGINEAMNHLSQKFMTDNFFIKCKCFDYFYKDTKANNFNILK